MVRRARGGATRRRRTVVASSVLAGVVLVGALVAARSEEPGAAADVAPTPGMAAGDRTRAALAGAATPTSTTTVPPTSTTAPSPATTTTAMAACDRRAELDGAGVPLPGPWAERVQAALADPAWGGVQRSISVWVAGYGEVVAVEPDLALLPASNEKLLTAVGARLLLDPAARFRTEVRLDGDDLVLVADGDPTLRRFGLHSLGALARQVRDAGVRQVAGVRVDATAFEAATTARGWQGWQVPTYVGPMSALVVDDNRGRQDPAYLADPAVGNAEAFADALRATGVEVSGPVVHGVAPPGAPVVASLASPTVAELSHDMLLRSDNEIAESLVREVGDGSTDAGLGRIADALEPWCLHLVGEAGDGSGLSRADHRSAREWRRLLQVALEQPWGDEVLAGLPVAGQSGTLGGRLTGPATNGNVRAKTGTIIGGSALSGHATTPDGRLVVFSIVANGDPAAATGAVAAIDHLVTAVVAG